MRYTVETITDDSTGLDKFLIVDSQTGSSVDSAYDSEYAGEICDFYNERDQDVMNFIH